MDTTHEIIEGKIYRKHVSRSNKELRDLEREHQKMGRKTWVNLWDGSFSPAFWILTVEILAPTAGREGVGGEG